MHVVSDAFKTPLECQHSVLYLNITIMTINSGATLAMTHAAFDEEHRLTSNRIVKRAEGKVTIEMAVLLSLKSSFVGTFSSISNIINKCKCLIYHLNPTSSSCSSSSPSSTSLSTSGQRGLVLGGVGADYKMAPNGSSSHGFLDTETDVEAKEEEVDAVKDKIADVTTILGAKDPMLTSVEHISPQKSSIFQTIQIEKKKMLAMEQKLCCNGKVSYVFTPNIPQCNGDLEKSLSPDPFFRADGINVLSGEYPLFCANGLMLELRRCVLGWLPKQ